jgi:hypothetical protein
MMLSDTSDDDAASTASIGSGSNAAQMIDTTDEDAEDESSLLLRIRSCTFNGPF